MRKDERALNLSIGISIISWGCMGIYFDYNHGDISLIRFIITLMNLSIGMLIIFRKPIMKMKSIISAVISFPSIILGWLIFKLAQPLNLWPTFAEITFISGALFTLISFIYLGRSFSIFPGLREIVSNGTYKIIRHPGYLGELIMIVACITSRINIISAIVFIFFIFGLLIRINEEEKILSQSVDYLKYMNKVKWKLIPYLW